MKRRKCSECGRTLDDAGAAFIELKCVVERMKEITAEIERGVDDERWWALQDEFTALIARASRLDQGLL